MNAFINLNPAANGGESSTVTVNFQDRILSLTIDTMCYGQHQTKLTVNIDNPEQLHQLADKLNMVAAFAQVYFKRNP